MNTLSASSFFPCMISHLGDSGILKERDETIISENMQIYAISWQHLSFYMFLLLLCNGLYLSAALYDSWYDSMTL